MKKPGWLKDAVATENGYVSPKGELLKSAKLSQAHIDEWNGVEKKEEAPVIHAMETNTIEENTEIEIVIEEEAPVAEEAAVEQPAQEEKKGFFSRKVFNI